MGVAGASFAAAVAIVQVTVGVDIAVGTRLIEDRIELRLKGGGQDPRQPARSHEASIEPWELVSV
jgi:hypothetical protein